jgi:hypothetical protein
MSLGAVAAVVVVIVAAVDRRDQSSRCVGW